MSNFLKIRTVGAELFHAGGQTDMTKQPLAFRNFANAPNIQCFYNKNTCVDCFLLKMRSVAPSALLLTSNY